MEDLTCRLIFSQAANESRKLEGKASERGLEPARARSRRSSKLYGGVPFVHSSGRKLDLLSTVL